MNQIRDAAIILVIVVAAFLVGKYIADKEVVPTAKPVQSIAATVTTTSSKVTATSKPITFTKVNNRGDQKIDPIAVQITAVKPIQTGEEVPITILPATTYKAKLNPYKIAVYGVYKDKLDYGVGVLYECFNYVNISVSGGIGTNGLIGGVGYTITPTTEALVGVSFTTKEPSIIFGVGVRL